MLWNGSRYQQNDMVNLSFAKHFFVRYSIFALNGSNAGVRLCLFNTSFYMFTGIATQVQVVLLFI